MGRLAAPRGLRHGVVLVRLAVGVGGTVSLGGLLGLFPGGGGRTIGGLGVLGGGAGGHGGRGHVFAAVVGRGRAVLVGVGGVDGDGGGEGGAGTHWGVAGVGGKVSLGATTAGAALLPRGAFGT